MLVSDLSIYPIIPQTRTEYLRKKSQASLQQTGKWTEDGEMAETSRGGQEIEHLNLFPLEDSSEKKGNAEYLKEKKEEKVLQKRLNTSLLTLLRVNVLPLYCT